MSILDSVREKDVRFLINAGGQVEAVVITPELWRQIVSALEDADDLALVKHLMPRLRLGPIVAGALAWSDESSSWQ